MESSSGEIWRSPEGPSHGDRDTRETTSQARLLPGFDFFLERTRQTHRTTTSDGGDLAPQTQVSGSSVNVSTGNGNPRSPTSSWLAAVTSRTTWALPSNGTSIQEPTTRRSLLRLAPAQVQMNADGSPGFFTAARIDQIPPKRFLKEHERCEIVLRVLAGERQAHLAKEFGISRAAVHYLVREKSTVLHKYVKKHTPWQVSRSDE